MKVWWTRPGSCRLGEPKAMPICLSPEWSSQTDRVGGPDLSQMWNRLAAWLREAELFSAAA
jgi:hypothetical protein